MTINYTYSCDGSQPIPVKIAQNIEDLIASGQLLPGVKLPPQRQLAFELNVAIATVGKAYKICRERKLIKTETGRGTFVLCKSEMPSPSASRINWNGPKIDDAPYDRPDPKMVSSIGNLPLSTLAENLDTVLKSNPIEALDYARRIPAHWLHAGQHWLGTPDWMPDEDGILPVNGAYAGLLAAGLAKTKISDWVAVEDPGYSMVCKALEKFGRRILPIRVGPKGLDLAALQKALKTCSPKVIYVTPTVQNPSTATMPRQNRDALIKIARHYDITIIEDNVYGRSMQPLPPLASLAPERTFHVNSLSKAVSAGLRVGWISCPENQKDQIAEAHATISGHWSFLIHELASQLVLSNAASQAALKRAKEVKTRHATLVEIFKNSPFEMNSHPDAPFISFRFPRLFDHAAFQKFLAGTNLHISLPAEFQTTHKKPVNGLCRLALLHPSDRSAFKSEVQAFHDLIVAGSKS